MKFKIMLLTAFLTLSANAADLDGDGLRDLTRPDYGLRNVDPNPWYKINPPVYRERVNPPNVWRRAPREPVCSYIPQGDGTVIPICR